MMKLTRRQKRIIKRKVKEFVGGALAVAVGVGMMGAMAYAWLTEPMPDWTEWKEEHHIGMVEVSDGYWMNQEDYEQMCREREEWKTMERAEEEAFYNDVLNAQNAATTEAITLKHTTSNGYTSIIKSYDWDADEAYMLMKIAMAEAESESTECKALVILTVLNRVWGNNEFPNTIEEVIFQKNQFTPISNGRYDRVEPDADCREALAMVEQGWDESYGCTYFEATTNEATWHKENLQELFTVDQTTFYKEK